MACSTQGTLTKITSIYNVHEINTLCSVDIAYDGCEGLDGKQTVLKGRLFTDIYNHPTIFPITTEIDDFEQDDWPNGINLLVNKARAAKFEKFDGNLVTVSGKLFTKCVLQYRDAKVREKTLNANRDDEDEIFIVMLAGTCHYVGRFISDPKVEAISENIEKQK